MPELPEVETVCRGLNTVTRQQMILGGEVLLQRTLAYPVAVPEFLAGLRGKRIEHWQRRGKYLLGQLMSSSESTSEAAGGWLGVHLRMTGQLLWVSQDTPLQKHTRVRLFFENGRELRFVDMRTFGQMWWIPTGKAPEEIISGLRQLGVEPFSPEFSAQSLEKKLKNRQRSIKAVLLDQSIVAGLGNIYADEALFLSGIRPDAIASELTLPQLERLYTAIIKVLQTAIDKGGTTFSDFLNVMGVNGNYKGVAWVYGRTGEPCRVCRTPIERIKITGRSTHLCPQCQTS